MVMLGAIVNSQTQSALWGIAFRAEVKRATTRQTAAATVVVGAPKDAPVKTYGAEAVARRREQKAAYMVRVRERARQLGVKETRTGFVAAVKATHKAVSAAFGAGMVR